jgi:hypothetical protein
MGSAWEQFQAYLDANGKDGTRIGLTLSQFVEASGRDVASMIRKTVFCWKNKK